MIEAGDWVDVARIDNEPVTLGVEIAKGGESPNMVLEATYSWYWAADVLARAGGLPTASPPGSTRTWAQARLGLEGLSDDLVEKQGGGNEEEPGKH